MDAKWARLCDAVLVVSIGVDVTLVTLAVLHPAWWFSVLHAGAVGDDLHVALLRRAAAQWTAFAIVQIVALIDWRRRPDWLWLVAGARLSDLFTDLSYFFLAPGLSPVAWVLLAPPLMNAGMAAILVAGRRRVAPGA